MKLKLPKNPEFYVYGAFLFIESIIYIILQIYDFAFDENLIYLKYAGILICLAFAAVGIYFYGKNGIVITVALVFTAISDLFILIMIEFVVGISTFIVVQLIHFARIYLINGKKPWISIGARIGLVGIGFILFGCLGLLNSPIVVLACIYFPQLIINTVESALLIKIDKTYILLFVGLVLFTLCDIFVGTYNAGTLGLNMSADLLNLARKCIWTVYLPAQVLIVLSVKKTEYRPFFKKTES